MIKNVDEKERIVRVYERRKRTIQSDLYSCFDPANFFYYSKREILKY